MASFILFLSSKGVTKRWELDGLDLSFHLKGSASVNPHIVIVEITDSDISKIGRWPWKRAWHATMARALKELGAKYTYFDIIFSESSTEEDDALFAKSIEESKNVYLPFVFQPPSFDIKTAFFPIERFASYAKGTGSINIYPDEDGALRRVPLIFDSDKGPLQHMALKIALDYTGMQIKEINSRYLLASNSREQIKVPLVVKNTQLINWMGTWAKTFKHYSFLEVLALYKDLLDNKRPLSALKDFKDSVCLVAVTAIGLYDIHTVPLQAEYPGIGVFATVLNNLIDKNFLFTPPLWAGVLLLYLLALLPAFLIFGERPVKEYSIMLVLTLFCFGIYLVLLKNKLLVNPTIPFLGIFSSSLTIGTYNFIRIAIERQKFFKMAVTDGLTGLYNIRYFKMLLETELRLARPDPTKKFVIVMSDVDHFKHFNDTYGHQVGDIVLKEVANALKNNVRSSDIVARYGGEEMIVLLRGSSLKDGLAVAEKLRKGIEGSVVKDEKNTYKVTASLGAAAYKSRDSVDSIIKRADDGLYKAKETGRNRVGYMEDEFVHLQTDSKETPSH